MSEEQRPVVLSSTYLYRGWPAIRKDEMELPDGRKMPWISIEYGGGVHIAALTEQQELILVRQYRHGTQRIEIEIPAGAVKGDEGFETAVRRELLEETGYQAERVERLLELNSNPVFARGTLYLYLASGLSRVADFDHHEIASVALVPFEEAYQKAKRGEFLSTVTILSILYLRACAIA